jgi:hypothetical protein
MLLRVSILIHEGSAMGTPKKPDIPADRLALYDKLIATMPEIERKGAANPYTSHNGHMFSLLLGPRARWRCGFQKMSAKIS